MSGYSPAMEEHKLLPKETACGMVECDPDRDSLDCDSLEGEWRSEDEEHTISRGKDGINPAGHHASTSCYHSRGGVATPMSPSTTRAYMASADTREQRTRSDFMNTNLLHDVSIYSSPIKQKQQQLQHYQCYTVEESVDDLGRCLEPVDRLIRAGNHRNPPATTATTADWSTNDDVINCDVTSHSEDRRPDLIAAHRNSPQQQQRHLAENSGNTRERRKECMFFVDLDDLPTPSSGTFRSSSRKRPSGRSSSNSADQQQSVYLYIDLENGAASAGSGSSGRSQGHMTSGQRAAGGHVSGARAGSGQHGMSASYHGRSALAVDNSDSDGDGYSYRCYDDDDDGDDTPRRFSRDTLTLVRDGNSVREGCSSSSGGGFLAMTGGADDDDPRQQQQQQKGGPLRAPVLPPQLSSRLRALQRRRRNHSIGGPTTTTATSNSSGSATNSSRSQQHSAPVSGTTPGAAGARMSPRTAPSRNVRASSVSSLRTLDSSGGSRGGGSRNAQQQQQQSSQLSRLASQRRISTGVISSAGASAVMSGGGTTACGGRRVVVGNTRRVSDTLQTRSVTRRPDRTRVDAVSSSSTSTASPAPTSVPPGGHGGSNSVSRRAIPASVLEKQQRQRRSFLRAHSGTYAAGGTVGTVGTVGATSVSASNHSTTISPPHQPLTTSSLRSHAEVSTSAANKMNQPTVSDRSVASGTVTRRDSAAGITTNVTGDSDNDNASDLSSLSCKSSTAVNRAVNVSWSRGAESVNQLTADFMNLLSSGLNADIVIETEDGELPCHSAILSARSGFFRDLLTSSQPSIPVSVSPNSSTKRILLGSHSAASVSFLLAHLYTASIQVPDTGLDLFDLLSLADRVSHASLIRLVESTIRARLCHMFHKPCPLCVPGVFLSLTSALDLRLTSLADRCVSWLTQHRAVVWTYSAAVEQLSTELCAWTFNTTFQLSESCLLDVLLDCSRLITSLVSLPSNNSPSSKLRQTKRPEQTGLSIVREMAGKLVNEAVVLASRCLSSLIASDRFMCLSDSPTDCELLERHLLSAADIQNAADAVVCADVLYQLQSVKGSDWCPKFVSLITGLSNTCSARSALTMTTYTSAPTMSSSLHIPSCRGQDLTVYEISDTTGSDRNCQNLKHCTDATPTPSYVSTSHGSSSSSQSAHQMVPPIMSASVSCVIMDTKGGEKGTREGCHSEQAVASAMSRSESFTICKHE